MGERDINWDDDEIVELLQEVGGIEPSFWEEGERHVLANKDAPQDVKADLLSVLEVTNYVYENKFPLAVERFKKLTGDQQGLLTMLVDSANGECLCPYCTAERTVRAELTKQNKSKLHDEEQTLIRQAHYRTLEEISRNKTYEVSEDEYIKMKTHQQDLFAVMARLEAAMDFLDEEDPRYDFASELLERIYG